MLNSVSSLALRLLSSASSFALESMPVPFAALPPVIEPPAFMSCPSRLTMRRRLPFAFDIRTASARVSATTVLPRRFAKIPSYFASKCTRSYATPTKPGSFTGASFMTPPLTVSTGRKVARPESMRFSISIALRPSFCVSITIFCIAAPRAVSIASAHSLSALTRFATGPYTPLMLPLADSRMTVLTAFEKPSYSFSISESICILASKLRQSTLSLLTFSVSCPTAVSRELSFMRAPSSTLLLLLSLSSSSWRTALSEAIVALLSSICATSSPTRLSASAMSFFMRSAASRLLAMLALKAAASESHTDALPSVSERRCLAFSASTSFSRIRSEMLPDDAYSASRLRWALSRSRLAFS